MQGLMNVKRTAKNADRIRILNKALPVMNRNEIDIEYPNIRDNKEEPKNSDKLSEGPQ